MGVLRDEMLANLPAVLVWKANVQQDKVGLMGIKPHDGFQPACRQQHLVAGVAKHLLHRFANRSVVVHYQDSFLH